MELKIREHNKVQFLAAVTKQALLARLSRPKGRCDRWKDVHFGLENEEKCPAEPKS